MLKTTESSNLTPRALKADNNEVIGDADKIDEMVEKLFKSKNLKISKNC